MRQCTFLIALEIWRSVLWEFIWCSRKHRYSARDMLRCEHNSKIMFYCFEAILILKQVANNNVIYHHIKPNPILRNTFINMVCISNGSLNLIWVVLPHGICIFCNSCPCLYAFVGKIKFIYLLIAFILYQKIFLKQLLCRKTELFFRY